MTDEELPYRYDVEVVGLLASPAHRYAGRPAHRDASVTVIPAELCSSVGRFVRWAAVGRWTWTGPLRSRRPVPPPCPDRGGRVPRVVAPADPGGHREEGP